MTPVVPSVTPFVHHKPDWSAAVYLPAVRPEAVCVGTRGVSVKLTAGQFLALQTQLARTLPPLTAAEPSRN